MIACMHYHCIFLWFADMSWLSTFSSEFIQSSSNFRATQMNLTKIRYDSVYYLLQYWIPETSPNSSLYKQASAEMTVQLLVQLGTQECSPPTHLWCGNDTVNNTDGWQIVSIPDPQLSFATCLKPNNYGGCFQFVTLMMPVSLPTKAKPYLPYKYVMG